MWCKPCQLIVVASNVDLDMDMLLCLIPPRSYPTLSASIPEQ